MLSQEKLHQPDPLPMQKQKNLDATMRAVLIDWMIEVCQEFALARETFYLALNFADRVLSKCRNIPRARYQLLGAACLFMAAKLEEIHPPKASAFALTTDGAFDFHQIRMMEKEVLAAL